MRASAPKGHNPIMGVLDFCCWLYLRLGVVIVVFELRNPVDTEGVGPINATVEVALCCLQNTLGFLADAALNGQNILVRILLKKDATITDPVTFGHVILELFFEAALMRGREAPFALDDLIVILPVDAQTDVAVQSLFHLVL